VGTKIDSGTPRRLSRQVSEDHRSQPYGLELLDGALAHLGIARTNALEAKASSGAGADAARVRALATYKAFLIPRKDPDADIPIYKQAKAEYAKLN
jgi:hypothetical protein